MKQVIQALVALAIIMMAGGVQESVAGDTDTVPNLPPIDSLWDYGAPPVTRAKFEEILPAARQSGDRSYYLQLQTQIARTYSLEGEFDKAHATLNTVGQSLADAPKIVEVRYLIERGRTFRSAGYPAQSEPLFVRAYKLGLEIGADFHAIDAAHMVALAIPERDDKLKWNLIGVKIAEKSDDERARGWLGSLCNNIGWDYHDHGEFDRALDMFDKALAFRIGQGKAKETAIAKWCIARTLRSLERHDEALKIQIDLQAEYDSTGQADGYVYEELGELYLLTGKEEQSQKYFALAYAELAKDDWFVKNEAARLQRMKELGKVED